jgi:DNA polymerase III sliding clamp (beta) subunit (PCNA family)
VKIVTQAGPFTAALTLAATGMRTNKKKPAHGAVRIVASAGAASCTGTDNSIAVITNAAAQVLEPGETAIPNDQLAALIAGFAANAVITITAEGGAATIVSQGSRYRLPTIRLADLPSVPAIDREIGRVEITIDDFLHLCSPLAAAETEATRFYLCGILWQSVADRLVGVSSDGRRLIRASIAAGEFSRGYDLIVPTQAVMALIKLTRSTKPAKVTLRRSRALISVAAPAFQFVSKLIVTQYPGYEAVIPPPSTNAATLSRTELLGALNRLRAVATIEPPILALHWDSAGTLSAFLARQRADGADIVAAETSGVGKVAVPLDQLAAMLGEFSDGARLRIEATEGRPLVIKQGEKLAVISRSIWNFNSEMEEEGAAAVA